MIFQIFQATILLFGQVLCASDGSGAETCWSRFFCRFCGLVRPIDIAVEPKIFYPLVVYARSLSFWTKEVFVVFVVSCFLLCDRQSTNSLFSFILLENWVSTPYFSCKEIAALVKTQSSTEERKQRELRLEFISLQLAKLSVYLWVTCSAVMVAVQINTAVNKPVPDTYFIATTMLIASYFQIGAFREYAVDRRCLEQQLRSFSVQSAMCSDSQDRSTIEETILGWFGTEDLEVPLA